MAFGLPMTVREVRSSRAKGLRSSSEEEREEAQQQQDPGAGIIIGYRYNVGRSSLEVLTNKLLEYKQRSRQTR